MKPIWHSIKQHPFSVFFYIIYCLLWYNAYGIYYQPVRDGGLLILAGICTAVVFIAISLLNAYHNNEYRFYFWFIAFIIMPVVINFALIFR